MEIKTKICKGCGKPLENEEGFEYQNYHKECYFEDCKKLATEQPIIAVVQGKDIKLTTVVETMIDMKALIMSKCADAVEKRFANKKGYPTLNELVNTLYIEVNKTLRYGS